jgi:serine/threonine protein kinase
MAASLAALHDAGFVHADVKPPNFLYQTRPDGKVEVKVADFGALRRCDPTERLRDM